jgi:hypothetical protein
VVGTYCEWCVFPFTINSIDVVVTFHTMPMSVCFLHDTHTGRCVALFEPEGVVRHACLSPIIPLPRPFELQLFAYIDLAPMNHQIAHRKSSSWVFFKQHTEVLVVRRISIRTFLTLLRQYRLVRAYDAVYWPEVSYQCLTTLKPTKSGHWDYFDIFWRLLFERCTARQRQGRRCVLHNHTWWRRYLSNWWTGYNSFWAQNFAWSEIRRHGSNSDISDTSQNALARVGRIPQWNWTVATLPCDQCLPFGSHGGTNLSPRIRSSIQLW